MVRIPVTAFQSTLSVHARSQCVRPYHFINMNTGRIWLCIQLILDILSYKILCNRYCLRCRDEKTGSERLIDVPKVTQLGLEL